MRWKIAISALAAAGVAVLASTGAMALRLHDDVYYYSGVTPGFGYTPSHHFRRWAWAYAGPVESCARRFRSYDPRTGTYVGYDGIRYPCP
jgi:BA14K-like protein